jgi:integrase
VDDAFYGMQWSNYLARNLNNPCSSFLVKSVREAAHRIRGHRFSRKEPVTSDILLKLVNAFGNNDENLVNLKNMTMCLLAYAGFLRFFEMINIQRSDIQFKTAYIALFIYHC